MALSPATAARLRRGFERQGYLLLEGFFPAAAIERLRAALARLEPGPRDPDWHFDDARLPTGETARVARLFVHAWMKSSAFLDHARSPELLDVVEALLGPDIRFLYDSCFLKPPGGVAIPWHRELGFFGADRHPTVTCYTLIDDAAPESGALRVVPRSHLPQGCQGPWAGRSVEPLPGQRVLAARAGSLVVMDHMLLHGSGANRSAADRRAYGAFYGLPETRSTFNGRRLPSLCLRGRRTRAEGPDDSAARFRRFYPKVYASDSVSEAGR